MAVRKSNQGIGGRGSVFFGRLAVFLLFGAAPAFAQDAAVDAQAQAEAAAPAATATATKAGQAAANDAAKTKTGAADPDAPIAHIVVTANAIPTEENQVGSSITVVTAEDIEQRQARNLVEALRDVPGLQVATGGGPGSATSFFLRGANSGRTAILVDGQPLANPWNADRAFDVNTLFNLDNVERIEVLRGPQSMLYGSDAMAGVINVVTKKGAGKPVASAMAEAGSRGTVISRVQTSGGSEKFDYSLGAGLYRTDGYSAYAEGRERDHYDNESLNLRLGGKPTDNLRFDLFTRYQNSSLDVDGYNPMLTDTPGENTGESFTVRPELTLSLLDDRWIQKAGFSYGHYEFTSDDKIAVVPTGQDIEATSYSARFDYQSSFKLWDWNTLTAGVDHTREWYVESGTAFDWNTFAQAPVHSRPEASEITGVYLQENLSFDERLFVTLGVRNDHHNTFGDRTTYRATAAYNFQTGTRLKASYGTGFKAPTLYQLWNAQYGNAGLRPETNQGWDFGIEQDLFDARLTVGATYFDIRYKDMLTWTPNSLPPNYGRFENVDRARTRGIESFVRWRLTDNLDLSAAYTYLDAVNETTGHRLGRRARHSGSVGVHWRFLERGDLDLRWRAEDWRYDGNSGGATLAGFGVVDVAAAWKVTDRFALTARAENLFDQDYQLAAGYRANPRAFFGGFKVDF